MRIWLEKCRRREGGVYEIGGDRLWIDILSSVDVGKLVDDGKVRGTKTTGDFFDVELQGSPDEIAGFLTSPDARVRPEDKGSYIAKRLKLPRG